MTNKEAFQTEQAVRIQLYLKRITEKTENFFNENKDTYYGDLGYVADQLEQIEKFLNDKYLTPTK